MGDAGIGIGREKKGMTEADTVRFMGIISDAFPDRLKVTPGMISIWAEMMVDISPEEAKAALVSYLADGPPHPPALSDIRRRAAESRVGHIDVGAAWEEVRRAIQKYGRDLDPPWSSPAIAGAVEAIGWRELCNTMDDDLPTVRAQWERYLRARVETMGKAENIGRLEEHQRRAGLQSAGSFLRLPGKDSK
jgi:hypothetical protein